jgi:glycosyltransferase involved in cell wall biosynthesis
MKAMSGRRKVLYICFDTIPAPKGASTHVTYFVKALTNLYDVTLMSVGSAAAEKDFSLAEKDFSLAEKDFSPYCGARHVAVPLNQPNFLDRALDFREAVWDELESNDYDLVHFRTMWAAVPIAEEKKKQNFKVICEVNGVDSIELKYHYPTLRANHDLLERLRAQERLAFETADVIITPSLVTKRYLVRQGVAEEKVVVIPNGVDVELFVGAKHFGVHAGNERQNASPLLLYLGTLAPWQGIDFLLDAFKRVVAQRPIKLQILGVGRREWRKTLEKQVRKLGLTERVEFLPPVPHEQVPAVIHAADVGVAPLAPTERNLVQGCCPVKIFEYMACGKPIVAANLPVVREILTHEEDALLYKIDKPSRLAVCLMRLAEDGELRQRLGENALRKVREQFGWQRAQESLMQVYTSIEV